MFPQIFPCWLKVNFFFLYFDFRFSFFDWLKVTFFTHRYTELNRPSVMLIPLASWRLVWKSVRIALSAYADRRIVLFFRNADFVVRAWITKHTSAFPAMAKESILDLTVKIMKIVKIPYRKMFMQWSSFKNLNHLLETKENLSSYNREKKSKKKSSWNSPTMVLSIHQREHEATIRTLRCHVIRYPTNRCHVIELHLFPGFFVADAGKWGTFTVRRTRQG